MDRIEDNVLNYQTHCDYQTLKRLNKLVGKENSRQIAFGRLLVNTLASQYGKSFFAT